MRSFPGSATEGAVHRAVCTTQSQSKRPESRQRRSSPTGSSRLPSLSPGFRGCQSSRSRLSHIPSRITTTQRFGRRWQKQPVNAKRFCCGATRRAGVPGLLPRWLSVGASRREELETGRCSSTTSKYRGNYGAHTIPRCITRQTARVPFLEPTFSVCLLCGFSASG